MSYLTALGCVFAIIAIVVVSGVIIAYVGKVIINLFSKDKRLKDNGDDGYEKDNVYLNANEKERETIKEYSKEEVLNSNVDSEEYSYASDVDDKKAMEEKKALESELGKDTFFADYKTNKDEKSSEPEDDDLMNMIDEISTDVMDDESETQPAKTSSELDKYSIDSILNDEDEDEDEKVEVEKSNETEESLNEIRSLKADIMAMLEELKSGNKEAKEEADKSLDQKIDENITAVEEMQKTLTENADERKEYQAEIEELKSQLVEINKKLDEQKALNDKLVEESKKEIENEVIEAPYEYVIDGKKVSSDELEERVENNVYESSEEIENLRRQVEKLTTEASTQEKVVTFQFSTVEQYEERIAILEERLRIAKKDLAINDKEYRPLEKVRRTLERDKAKLRRKEAIAAKKKVALYGVNNYVDIDKEKAEKLAHELALLDGLKLSVNNCEEVMRNNADRFPVLERTHYILKHNIKDLEDDIEMLNFQLQALKDKKGK